MMKTSRIVAWGLMASLVFALTGCPGPPSQNDDDPMSNDPFMAIIANPDIPTMSVIGLSDGRQITTYGTKNPDGSPLAITSADIDAEDLDPKNKVHVEYDATGNPVSATLAGGGSVTFNYISPNQIDLTAVTSDGVQTTISYDPVNQQVLTDAKAAPSASSSKTVKGKKVVRQSSATTNVLTGTINSSCISGAPVSPEELFVNFDVDPYSGKYPRTKVGLTSQYQAAGTYAYYLPKYPLGDGNNPDLDGMVSSFQQKYGEFCTNVSISGKLGMTAALQSYILAIAAAVNPAAAVVYNVGFMAIQVFCHVPTGLNVAKYMLDLSTSGTVEVYAKNGKEEVTETAYHGGGYTQGSAPTINLTFNYSCIDHIDIEPSAPSVTKQFISKTT